MRVTTKLIEHLKIVAEHGPVYPGMFATYAWPDAPRRRAGGNSQHQGGDNMAICAGGRLGKLAQAKLVYWTRRGYLITPDGQKILKEAAPG